MKRLIITPAIYSKSKPTNQKEAIKAWEDGADFQIISGEQNGRYLSIRDIEPLRQEGYTQLSVRLLTGRLLTMIDL